MCGIAGCYRATGAISREWLETATQVLHHRGPDGQGTWLSPRGDCGLAHTRLSIIDLAAGAQPMVSHDGRYAITFNGEIYNYRQLRSELLERGHHFRTHSDTEVILEAYRCWGPAAPEHFHGMFAFAIYDTIAETLFAARDRTGIKPFYYASLPDQGWVFASEIKALLQAPEIPRRLNSRALVDFLALGYPLAPHTMFADIFELPPGMTITWSGASMRIDRYWQWKRTCEGATADRSLDERMEQTLEVLRHSLSEHLVADVPVAALLSGGIDSTLSAAILAKELGAKIDVFHVRFPFRGYDESPYARQVAEWLQLPYHEVTVAEAPPEIEEVENIFGMFDQPFGDSSALPTYLVCREISRHVKVALGGDGADEMFGGYPRFRFCDLASSLGQAPRAALAAVGHALPLTRAASPSFSRKLGRVYRAATAKGTDRLFRLSGYAYPDDVIAQLSPGVTRGLEGYRPTLLPPCASVPTQGSIAPSRSSKAPRRDVDGLCFRDSTIHWTLPGDYLRKVDVMSSAHGLEVRVPYLGEEVLTHAATLARRDLYNRSSQKILLRRLAATRLPPQVAKKKKTGFEIPLDAWLGDQGRRAVAEKLRDPAAAIHRLFTPATVAPLADAFVHQQWDHAVSSRFNLYQRVYLLWTLQSWLQRWNVAIPDGHTHVTSTS